MLATIRDDTWNAMNMQHITPNSKRWNYSDIPGGGTKIKGPAHVVEVGLHLRNRTPTPTHFGVTSQYEYLKHSVLKESLVMT